MTKYQRIREKIEKAIVAGKKNFIIYPFGENGILTKQILNWNFCIEEKYIIDNKLAVYNQKIKNIEYFEMVDCSELTVLLTIENSDVIGQINKNIRQYFSDDNIINIFDEGGEGDIKFTECGKYSYGPLCDHWLVKSVGAFCSFAIGSDVVENHPVDYLSTHPFIYADSNINSVLLGKYEEMKRARWYVPGIKPKGIVKTLKRIEIGNDVWLGRNVIITNGANIGNGVIAGAGAVITKDVPDYAVVGGVPAQIIRYRYSEDQIEKLNKIAWWNWSDNQLKERYSDFFIGAEDFIDKYF